MLHKMGYEHTCPECGKPCTDDDFREGAETCKSCEPIPLPDTFRVVEAHLIEDLEVETFWGDTFTVPANTKLRLAIHTD